MKKFLVLISLMLIMSMAGCGGTGQTNDSGNESGENNDSVSNVGQNQESPIQVASDGAQMQTDDPDMPTRVIENGTKINMHFGDTIIPGILNDSDTAKSPDQDAPIHCTHE